MSTLTITLSEERFARLKEIATRFNVSAEDLARVGVEELLKQPDEKFAQANWRFALPVLLVFLSAMIQLEKRAKQLGANAVVNIVSYYQKNIMSSPTEFECHAGAIMAGVALRGEFVKIAE